MRPLDEIKLNGQVVFREKLRNCTRIRIGTILGFKGVNNEVATVAFSDDPRKPRNISASARIDIPVKQLSSAQKVYGRTKVQVNPTFRNVAFLVTNR